MKGTWKGTYKYVTELNTKVSKIETLFTIIIAEYDGLNFKGTVTDDLESGGTRGEGVIKGKLKEGKIEFVKQMPIATFFTKEAVQIEISKKHKPIYYSGILNNGAFEGKWKIKGGILFHKSVLRFSFGTFGEWKMHKISDL
ncbi:MAG: hypothetical protein JZU53_16555 [Paludibacter sp.]|nr:hypothetical protein [Paludibacter sp.]